MAIRLAIEPRNWCGNGAGMITAIVEKLGKWLVYLAAGLVLLFGVYSSGRKSEQAKAAKKEVADAQRKAVIETEQAREAAKREIETVKGANDVQSKINRIDSGDVVERLRSDWSRD